MTACYIFPVIFHRRPFCFYNVEHAEVSVVHFHEASLHTVKLSYISWGEYDTSNFAAIGFWIWNHKLPLHCQYCGWTWVKPPNVKSGRSICQMTVAAVILVEKNLLQNVVQSLSNWTYPRYRENIISCCFVVLSIKSFHSTFFLLLKMLKTTLVKSQTSGILNLLSVRLSLQWDVCSAHSDSFIVHCVLKGAARRERKPCGKVLSD